MNLELLTELQTVKEELTFNEALPSIFGGKDVTGFPVLVDTELSEQEAKQLSDRLKLKNQKLHADFERLQTKLKPLPHNLAKKTVGKHVFPLAFTHSWKSPRSKYLWRLLQERVLGPDRALIQDEEEMEKSPGKVNSSIINQGFKHFKTIKRNFEIICFAANPKNSHPTEGVDTKRNLIKDTNDDEDFYEEVAVQNRSSAISLILVDSQRSLATWNISEGSSNLPTQTLQLDHEVNSLVYLSKYQSFAALTGLFTVKFFNSNLEYTNHIKSQYPLQSIQYEQKHNELVGIGTHQVIFWPLDLSKNVGLVEIIATSNLVVTPSTLEDDWISCVMLLRRTRQVYISIGNDIHIYSMDTGDLVRVVKSVLSRRISCLACHETYLYILVGGVDGIIKVLNIFSAEVHEFVAHSRAVVSIAFFPTGPLFVTCGRDQTVRLFNLKYFKAITTIHIKDKPLEMCLLEEFHLLIKSRNNIDIWDTNQFNINVANLSSSIAELNYVERIKGFHKDYPPRIFSRTTDGVARLISPTNGRTISATLPLTESLQVLDISYFVETERMYVLLQSGEILVFQTNLNPCTIVESWDNKECKDEGLTKLVICSGEFDYDDQLLCPPSLKSFGFLLSATIKGYVILFGRNGILLDRYQLHLGKITHFSYEPKSKVLVSAGEDEKIRISTINPFYIDIIQVKIDIMAGFIPRALSLMGNRMCVAAVDASICMFDINISKKEWKLVPKHQRDADHTERVTCIIHEPSLSIFISISQDRSMRIWNRENRLIRQIQFEEEISGICLANAKGDVLIGIGSRIDMVKASVYLPHNYQEKLAKIRITKPDIEKSLKFDDNLVSVQKPKGIDNLQRTSAYFDKTNAFEIFSQANLLWHIIPESEKYNISKRSSIKYSMRNSSLRGGADEDSVYFQNINLDIFLQKYDLGRVREKSIISISKSPTFESLKLSPSIDHLPHTRKVSNTNESSDKSYLPDLLPVESSSLEYEIKPKTRRYIPQDGFQPNTLGHIVPILPVNLPQNLIKIKLEPSIPKPKIAYKSLLLKFNDLNNQTSQSLTVIPPVSNVTINTVTPSGVTISTVTPSNITTNPVPPSGIPINPIPPIPTPIPTNPKSQSTPPTLLPLLYEPLLNYKWTPTNLLFHSYSTCITRDGKLSRTPLNLSGDGIVPILTGIYPSLDLSSKVEMVNYLTSHFPPHSLSKLFEIFEQDMISWIKIDDMDLILEYGVEIRDERLLHKLGIKFEKPNLDDILRGVREMKGKKVGKVLDLLRGRKRVVKRGGRGSFEDCIDGLNYLYYVECEKKSSELMRNVKKVEDGEKRARGLNLKSEQTVHLAQNHELVPRVLSPAPRVLDSKSEKTALLVENHKLEVVLRPRKEVKQAISRITQRRKPLVKPVRPFLGKPAVKITLNSMPMGRASCQLSSLVGQSECQVSSVILTNQEFSTFDNGKDSFKTSRKFFLPSL